MLPAKTWEFALVYSRLQNTARGDQEVAAPGGVFTQGFFPIWSLAPGLLQNDYVTGARMSWHLNLNLLDAESILHTHFKTPCVALRSTMGIRAVDIDQKMHVSYTGGIFVSGLSPLGVVNGIDQVNMRNDFWGAGPKLGLAADFLWGSSFCFSPGISGSYLLGTFRIPQTETYLNNVRFNQKREFFQGRWALDAILDIRQKLVGFKGGSSLDLLAGWEYHIFFNQNKLQQNAFHLLSGSRNLVVQGIDVGLLYAF